MAYNTGMRTSYTDTSHGVRSVSDVIWMMDWTRAPLLNLLTIDAASKFKLRNWPSRKPELYEDSLVSRSSLLNEALDNSETAVDVDDGTAFRKGDIVGVEDSDGDIAEKMYVSSVSSNTLTVVRGYGATSATTHDDNSPIRVLTRAMPEGEAYTTGPTTSVSGVYNYVQLFSEAVKVTGTEQAISSQGGYYGVADQMAYQVRKLFNDNGRAGQLARMLEATFYYGERVERTGDNALSGSMGGFETFVTTNVTDLSGAEITRKDIHTTIRQIHDAAGMPDLLICSALGKEKITAMYEGSIRTERPENTGGSEITMIKTPLGEVEVLWGGDQCPNDRYYFVDSSRVGWFPIPTRQFHTKPMREGSDWQGDFFVTDIIGEYSFMVANEEGHGIIKGAKRT